MPLPGRLPYMRFGLRTLIITGVGTAGLLLAQAPAGGGNQKGTPPAAAAQRPTRTLPLSHGLRPGETITITADKITATLTPARKLYQATGAVQIDLRDLRLSADAITYDSQTGVAVATGHVAFDSEGEQTHIEGTHATYNFFDSTGEFDDFHGVSGVRLHGRQATQISSNPLIFSGAKLIRLGEEKYRLLHGQITSCSLPNPKWNLTAAKVEVDLGEDARLYHAVFRLFNVPIFYAPFLTHSTERNGRHGGVLLPVVSHSNIKGYILGDSYYFPVARNVNLTLGGEYLSERGWADHLDFASLPTRNSALDVQLDGVFDRGALQPDGTRVNQGGQELHLTGDQISASGFRTVADVDYLSSYLYRLVFQNTFAQAINSEAVSTVFTEKQSDGQDLAVIAHRYQNFLGTAPYPSLSLAALPSLDWTAYAQTLERTLPLYFSWDFNAGLLDRSEPGFATGAMERVDLDPHVTLPVATPVGAFSADLSVRSTLYSEQQSASTPAGAAPVLLPGALWRDSGSLDLEWRPPALARVFASPGHWLGTRLEHVFEPQLGYHVTGGVADADQVIRFDSRDLVANTREVEYGFTNRLLSAGAHPGQSRELISWTLLQKYYFDPTFGGALVPGERNVFLTTALLSPFDVAALPLRFSPLSSVVRISPFTRFDGQWRLDYDSHDHEVADSAFSGNFHFGKGFFSGSQYFLRTPPGLTAVGVTPSFDQMRVGTGYGNLTAPGYSVAGGIAYDLHTGQLQYASLQLAHNWDCCGFSVEYRRFDLATLRRENQFLVSFNLANVATFGNLRRQDRLF